MNKMYLVVPVALMLNACQSGPTFHVKGEIADAEGKTLYLEASRVEGMAVLDSVKLTSSGAFDFKQPRPEAPDFYRLRMENQFIHFSVDSTETILIKAPYQRFSTDYTVEGSQNCSRIKELVLKQIRLQNEVDRLSGKMRAGEITYADLAQRVGVTVNDYKDDVRVNYIYAAPNATPAYFALFLSINNARIFDPLNNQEDIKCFAAVATSLNSFYPDAVRSKYLYNLAIKGIKNTRPPREQTLDIPEDRVAEVGIINIDLEDINGNAHRLTDLKGKVVLLDFTVFQSTEGVAHNYMLRELYNKYAGQGLEIYQVSLDADEHFWKTSAGNLPWICVRDDNGIYSTFAAIYNVQQVPSYFLINKENELSARGENIKNLEEAIKKML
jgi:peroxiredoxin